MNNAELTLLLNQWQQGDESARESVGDLVFQELEYRARRQLKSHPLMETRELVNEAFLKLLKLEGFEFADRLHFYRLASAMMKNLLLDELRSQQVRQRAQECPITESTCKVLGVDTIGLEIESALQSLYQINPRTHQVVTFRVFLGMKISEVAEALQISNASVKRDWAFALMFLKDRIGNGA